MEEANEYNGFNLIVGDLATKSMVYVSNRPKGGPLFIQLVPPGIHVLSNAMLDSPWPKVYIYTHSIIIFDHQHNHICIDMCWFCSGGSLGDELQTGGGPLRRRRDPGEGAGGGADEGHPEGR